MPEIIKGLFVNFFETENPKNLFRFGAKTSFDIPIETTKIGENYLIDNGVGRSMRAYKNDDPYVFGVVNDKYGCLQNVKEDIEFGKDKNIRNIAKRNLHDFDKFNKIIGKKDGRIYLTKNE